MTAGNYWHCIQQSSAMIKQLNSRRICLKNVWSRTRAPALGTLLDLAYTLSTLSIGTPLLLHGMCPLNLQISRVRNCGAFVPALLEFRNSIQLKQYNVFKNAGMHTTIACRHAGMQAYLL